MNEGCLFWMFRMIRVLRPPLTYERTVLKTQQRVLEIYGIAESINDLFEGLHQKKR